MISTRDLSALPDLPTLRRRMQALAMLDAMLSPEWETRFFSFDSHWAKDEQMGSMRDGEGGHYFAWFGPAGCWIKGFEPDCPMSPFHFKPPLVAEGVLDAVPAAFAGCLREPAFVIEETTFCIWRSADDSAWRHGPVNWPADDPDPDGSAQILAALDGNAKSYVDWAKGYYERDVPLAAVEAIYALRPLHEPLARGARPQDRPAGLRRRRGDRLPAGRGRRRGAAESSNQTLMQFRVPSFGTR